MSCKCYICLKSLDKAKVAGAHITTHTYHMWRKPNKLDRKAWSECVVLKFLHRWLYRAQYKICISDNIVLGSNIIQKEQQRNLLLLFFVFDSQQQVRPPVRLPTKKQNKEIVTINCPLGNVDRKVVYVAICEGCRKPFPNFSYSMHTKRRLFFLVPGMYFSSTSIT